MNSEPTRKIRSSARSEENFRRVISPSMDFTVYGSPAPTYFQRPASVKKKKPTQPPNTPKDLFKTRKPLQLPIEKILMLNEKLKSDKREKIKLELSSRQIKLQDKERDERSVQSLNECHLRKSEKNDEESTDFSSTIDLSIDLSTVTDSDHESDLISEDQDDFVPRPLILKERQSCSSSSCTESPSKYIWRLTKSDNLPAASEESIETGYPCSLTTKCSSAPCAEFCDGSCNTTHRSSSDRGNILHGPSLKCFRSRSADLIHLYVRTVDDQGKLTKYFRPCHDCNKACCICPDLLPGSSRSFSVYSDTLKFLHDSDCRQVNLDKMVETDPEITKFEKTGQGPQVIQSQSASRSNSRNSEFSDFLVERYLHKRSGVYGNNESDMVCDSGMSTLQLDEVNESDGSPGIGRSNVGQKSIPLSVLQLATAAQCARILANSLESVLEVVDNGQEEYFKDKEIVRFKGEDINSMFETLLSLKNQFSVREQKRDSSINGNENMNQKKWIDFTGNKSPTSLHMTKTSCQQKHFEDKISDDQAFQSNVNIIKSDDLTCFEDNFDGKYLSQL